MASRHGLEMDFAMTITIIAGVTGTTATAVEIVVRIYNTVTAVTVHA